MQSKKKKKWDGQEKFSFSMEFQLEVLRFLIQSKESPMVLPKVKPGYFALIEHSVVLDALKKHYKKYKKIPGKPVLIETMTHMLNHRDYVDLVTTDDVENITKIINELYANPLKDEEVIHENIYKFAAYLEMKALNEEMDFSNYNLYEDYQNRIANILKNSKPLKDEEPAFMVKDTVRRQLMRTADPDIVPTPYWQLNALSNGNGYPKASIFVLLDRPKAKKTFSLINISRSYLAMKKNVLYIDTENGKKNIMERMVQSTMNKTKLEIISGEYDKMEQRHMRKYKRLGVEFIVERVPALVGDANTIRNLVLRIEADYGIHIDILVIDYAAKLASVARDKEDIARINNVYIELDNLANELNLDAVWTAQHITREGAKHKATRYEDNDIASSISIIRNAQCILGLNSTDEEEENGVQRLEVVVQRDGKPHGRALFNFDADRQRWREFSREARAKYDETQGVIVDGMIRKSSKTNPNADPGKAKHQGGDI